MTKPDLELRSALLQIDARWDDERSRLGVQRAERTVRVRRQRRAVLAGAGMALALFALGWQWRAQPAPPARQLRLADGSQVLLLDQDSRVQVTLDSPRRTQLELVRGRARFEVVPRPERVFRVQSGAVAVQVLGTVFELKRAEPSTHVSVTRGRVAVESGEGHAVLSAGEAGWFPRALIGEDARTAEPPDRARASSTPDVAAGPAPRDRNQRAARTAAGAETQAQAPDARPRVAQPAPRFSAAAHAADDARASDAPRPPPTAAMREDDSAATSSWRELAAHGQYARAYARLQTGEAAPSAVEELLLAADAARLSGHPEAALPYLERVVHDHPRDSRAALAAFTLGGVLLEQLARPAEAEAAYARARSLALHASLAQDALARQVEAAQRAGDSARARALATEYVAQYPAGRRIHAVRRFGGLPAQ